MTQVFQIASGEIGLRSILAVAPTFLDGIQFRTVRRQILEAEPGRMFDREILGRLEMGPKIVPDEYDPITEMPDFENDDAGRAKKESTTAC